MVPAAGQAASEVPEDPVDSEVPVDSRKAKRLRGRSDNVLALVHILDAQLDVGTAPVVVLDYGVADIERIAGLDVIIEIRHIEGYRRNLVIGL